MAITTRLKEYAPEIRELVIKLRKQGRSIDAIRAKLEELDVDIPRSTLGEFTKEIDAVAAQMEESRIFADAIVNRFGEDPESKTVRLNMQMMQTVIYKSLRKIMSAEAEGKDNDGLTTRQLQELSKTIANMTQAAKTDAEFIAKVREEARKDACEKAAEAVTVAGKQQGLNESQVAFIRAEILGVEVQR